MHRINLCRKVSLSAGLLAALFIVIWMPVAIQSAIVAAAVEGSKPLSSSSLIHLDCTPIDSYKATKAVQKQVFDWAQREFSIRAPEDLPAECDLHPWKDVHYEHNTMREPEIIGRRSFKCKKCHKTFKSWEYLDRHIQDRHQPGQGQEKAMASSTNPTTAPPPTCLGRFCAFIPCDEHAQTVISSLPEHHPERTRSAFMCKEVFAKCFPPSRSSQFASAHEAMEAFFCEGKPVRKAATSSSLSGIGSSNAVGISLRTVLSWSVLIVVIFYYLYSFISNRQPKPRAKGLGYIPPPRADDNKPKLIRRQVQSTFALTTPTRNTAAPRAPEMERDDDLTSKQAV